MEMLIRLKNSSAIIMCNFVITLKRCRKQHDNIIGVVMDEPCLRGLILELVCR